MHLSLYRTVCADPDPTFAWCLPTIAHFNWDYRPVVRRVVRWADKVARGKEDRRQTMIDAEFEEGGTEKDRMTSELFPSQRRLP